MNMWPDNTLNILILNLIHNEIDGPFLTVFNNWMMDFQK